MCIAPKENFHDVSTNYQSFQVIQSDTCSPLLCPSLTQVDLHYSFVLLLLTSLITDLSTDSQLSLHLSLSFDDLFLHVSCLFLRLPFLTPHSSLSLSLSLPPHYISLSVN